MIPEFILGFEIKIISNAVAQQGTGILMIHPNDFENINKKPSVVKSWDGRCRCGHLHSEHNQTQSHNYSAGRCTIGECRCAGFVHDNTEYKNLSNHNKLIVQDLKDQREQLTALKQSNEEKDKEIISLNEILSQKMELLRKANERIEELETLISYAIKIRP